MTVEIKEVSTHNDLRKFIQFPNALYRKNPYWIPVLTSDEWKTLDPKKNAAFESSQARYWLAYKEGKLAGRIAAILSEGHRSHWNQSYMRFGWIDFIDDIEVVAALMHAAEGWALEKGCTAVHGPVGFSDMDHAGMLVEGFDELPTMINIYNHAYYPKHLEHLGYIKDTDWVEYELLVPATLDPKISKLAEIILKRNNLHMLKSKSKKDLLPYAPKIFGLLNEAYSKLYGFVPLNDKQIADYTKQYFGFIKPEFVPVVINDKEEVVAFGITMPSLTRALQKANGHLYPFGFIHILKALNKNDRADLYLVAVKPELQGLGLNALLINQVFETFRNAGITKVESNPELEDNTQVQAQWKHFEHRQHKRRRVYIKHLTARNS
jgi:GNAT superfamily N-acetyltransferase